MVGLREHVDGPHLLDAERSRGEYREVARQRFGVAGHVDNALRRNVEQRIERPRHASRAGRVQQHRVDASCGEFVQHVLRARLPQFHVRDALDVHAGVRHRSRRLLNRDDALRTVRHQHGERGDAGVGVDDGLRAVQPQLAHDEFGHLLGLPGVHLEERRGADPEAVAEQRLLVMLLAGGERHVHVLEGGLQQVVAGVHAVAKGELGRLGDVPLQGCQRVVDPRRHQQALLNFHVAAALLVDVAETPALLAHGEAGVVAVAQRVGAGERRQRLDVEAADALQGVGQHFPLHLQLALVGDVLPLAAGALAEVSAGGRDAVRRRVVYVRHACGDVAPAGRNDLCSDGLAGDAAEDEDWLAVVGFCERLAVPAKRAQFQRERRSLLAWG